MGGQRIARDTEHTDDLRRAVEISETTQTPARGDGVRTLTNIAMPGSFTEKPVAHGLGKIPRGWLAISVRVAAGTPAEYPNEIRRDRTHLVLTTVTPETVDLLVW